MRTLEELQAMHAKLIENIADESELIPISSSIMALISQCRLPEGHLDKPLLEDLLLEGSLKLKDPILLDTHIKAEAKEEVLEKYHECKAAIDKEEADAVVAKQADLDAKQAALDAKQVEIAAAQAELDAKNNAISENPEEFEDLIK